MCYTITSVHSDLFRNLILFCYSHCRVPWGKTWTKSSFLKVLFLRHFSPFQKAYCLLVQLLTLWNIANSEICGANSEHVFLRPVFCPTGFTIGRILRGNMNVRYISVYTHACFDVQPISEQCYHRCKIFSDVLKSRSK